MAIREYETDDFSSKRQGGGWQGTAGMNSKRGETGNRKVGGKMV